MISQRGQGGLFQGRSLVELTWFIGLVPLAFSNLRAQFDQTVTASDASSGGGFVCSKGLTPYGFAASVSQVRGDIPEPHDFCQVLSIGLFDGIGALRVAMDVLGAPVAGHVSIECNPLAQRVVEANFPETLLVQDVEEVTADMVTGWALRFSGVGLVLLGAGPPCQGVSGLNADRKGALRDHRSCLFRHVPRIEALCRAAFPWAQIQSLTENVASMDYQDCQLMNDEYELEPWYIDAGGVCLSHRPRLYWVSWELTTAEGVRLLQGSDGRLPICGEVKLTAEVETKAYLEPGADLGKGARLPTFTTSRPSSRPLRKPAGLRSCAHHELERWRRDQHRFPPYQYRDENCVWAQGMFRPPSVVEREVILGFPAGYTSQCMKKADHGSKAHEDCRLTLLGNSWAVPVVAWLLSVLFGRLGIIEPISLQQLVDRLRPGGDNRLQGLLRRPPLARSTATTSPSHLLIRKLAGLASLKGEDLLLQGPSEAPVRFHRLRASIPAALWRWRIVSGWRWTGSPEHINVLEARAVLTTLRWRVEQLKQLDQRCVHLVDSQVVLHCLTRGRSSSRKLRRTVMKIGSLLLASGLQPFWGYVDTHQNPADRPSRWATKKRWLKKPR